MPRLRTAGGDARRDTYVRFTLYDSQASRFPPTEAAHATHRFLRLEALEPRELLAADPLHVIGMPGTAMIGQTATIDIGFSNASPTDTGYGPYVDLYLPTTGAMGPASKKYMTDSRSSELPTRDSRWLPPC